MTFGFPTTDEEIWRYSKVNEIDFGSYLPGQVDTRVSEPQVSSQVGPISPADFFEEANFSNPQTTSIRIECDTTRTEPIVVEHRIGQSGILACPRLIVDARENCKATIVERFSSDDEISSLVIPVVELHLAESAQITYIAINDLGCRTWQIGYQHAIADTSSEVRVNSIAIGGKYARIRSQVSLAGPRAVAKQVALYFANDSQMHDFRTIQEHLAPKTKSDLLFKGAVKDLAQSVYTGTIRIHENASKSVAVQTNRNLLLSSGAAAKSVPNLEIETNDVQCNHASTIGPIDAEQIFYLQSKGISTEIAERLVLLGFFAEVLDRLPRAPALTGLRAKIEAKFIGEIGEKTKK